MKFSAAARCLLLGALTLLFACSGSPAPKTPTTEGACSATMLAACEKALAKAPSAATSQAVGAYVAGRLQNSADDPWATLWTALRDRSGKTSAVVDTRSQKSDLGARNVGFAPVQGARNVGFAPVQGADETKVIASQTLPEPTALKAEVLMLAMAAAAGYEQVIWVGASADEKQTFEVFPSDPLSPFLIGIPGVLVDRFSKENVALDIEIERSLRRAFALAGAFKYLEAAKETAQLSALLERRAPSGDVHLRARFGRSLLSAANLTLEAPVRLFGGSESRAPAAKPSEVEGAPGATTPYGALLRVRLSDSPEKEWKVQSRQILPAVSDDRRELATAYFSSGSGCSAPVLPPVFDRPGDITFAGLLPGSLAGARVEALSTPIVSGLPLSAFYPRYEALVARVEEAHLFWALGGTLLRQRGELPGIRPEKTATYKLVTERGISHISALRDLSMGEPERYSATAELQLAFSPGLLGDETLRTALIELTQTSTRMKLLNAEEPDAIASSLAVGAFAGMSYPEAVRDAHYLALQSAFATKIKGVLSNKTGWGAAALFGLDALFRVMFDLGPNLTFSSEQVVRALSDPKIVLPNVAAVISAAARYAVLAKDKPIAIHVTPAQSTKERIFAREELRKAILGMGASGEAPFTLADDVTTLADGVIALATVVAHHKTPKAGTCQNTQDATDIEISHAITKLSVVRGKILQNPKFKSGNGLWTRRTKLLVSLLSDVLDFAQKPDKGGQRQLTLSAHDVEEAFSSALREWDEPGARDAVIGIYGLVRFFLSNDSSKRFEGGGPHLVRALRGIGKFLQNGTAQSSSLLDALAETPENQVTSEDISGALVSLAKLFYEKGQADKGDVFLLGTLLMTSVRRAAPPKEAILLAAQYKSRIEWALGLFAEVHAAETNGRPNVAAFSAGATQAAMEKCAVGRLDDTFSVLGAIRKWNEGKRKEAREAIDSVLKRAEESGLVVPRMNYQYTEKRDNKVFTLSFALTHGAGFVEGANAFQVGLGFSTVSERKTALELTAASPDETAYETARYYIRAASLGAAYNLLDGDVEGGALDARRAVSAIISGVRLGGRTVMPEPSKWAVDSRALLAVDAELSAEMGLPFLAGDLWTVVKESFSKTADDAEIASVFALPPIGLAGSADFEPAIERAKKVVQTVAEPLSCTAKPAGLKPQETPVCKDYSLSLSLRIADIAKKLPRLSKSKNEPSYCGPLRSLDTFLGQADSGAYDPDAFTKAALELKDAGKVDEASTLLGRHRKEGHCNPTLIKIARELGRSSSLLPASRADMLAVAVNCWVPGTAGIQEDLVALNDETKKLTDPMRNLKLLFFVADLAMREGKPELLLSLVSQPDFVERYLRNNGNAAAMALVLHHAAHYLSAAPMDLAATEGPFHLLCSAFPSDDRQSECNDLKVLRDPSKNADERKVIAKNVLAQLFRPTVPKAAPKP